VKDKSYLGNVNADECQLTMDADSGVLRTTPGCEIVLEVKEILGRIRIRSAEYPVGTPILASPASEVRFTALPGHHELKINSLFSDIFDGEGELCEKCSGSTPIDRLSPEMSTRYYSICA
jgi:hypothetical protein